MTLTELLGMMRVYSGPNGNNDYICACPVCDKGSSSHHLKVADGYKNIVFRCAKAHGEGIDSKEHTAEICRELGIKMVELVHDDRRGDDAPKRGRPPRKLEKPPVYKPTEPQMPSVLETTYVYRDVHGNQRFCVERLRKADGDKDIRQYYIDDSGKRVNSGLKTRYGDTIYMLPELLTAIRKGSTVFIVEGEKDVDNLWKMGYPATCNVGGTVLGWKDEYSHWFEGADVIILADNDPEFDDKGKKHYKGEIHAKKVADSVRKVARRVQLCDELQKYCETLPSKGDISDLIAIEGADARNIINRIVRETPEYDPDALRWWEDPRDRVAELFRAVKPYDVVNGQIVKITDKGISPLSDFVAVIRSVVTKDDGIERKSEFEIDGWDVNGHPLDTIRINANDYESMGWATNKWNVSANICPGSLVRQNLSYAISKVGAMTAKRWIEYTHTGWRKVRGKWCYLYHGGAIGADDVSVSLEGNLKSYTFHNSSTGYDDITTIEGIACTLGILDVIPHKISIPLLSTIFLAPLREFLEQAGIKPRYALWLLGGTQTKKTTCSTLALAHFGGDFNNGNIPANFRDTANTITKKAFILKDMPIIVDDFHPQSSMQERRKMTDTAQALARAFGDGASRGRLSADLKLRENYPPRGVAIMSGEDLPDVGESGLARYYIVNFKWSDIDLYDEKKRRALTDLQLSARHGYMQKSMIGYIKWIAGQTESLPEMLEGVYMDNREKAMQLMTGQFARAPETIAMMMTAYGMMLKFMRDEGFLTDADVEKMTEEAWAAVVNNARKQSRELHEDRPSAMFVTAIQSLLLTEQATVRPIAGGGSTENPNSMVGYFDDKYYYFLPDPVFKQVHDLYSREGMEFPLTKKMLWKQLKEDKIIAASDNGVSTKTKRVQERTVRTLCIAKATIDRDGIAQTEMQFDEVPENEVTKGMV